MANITNSLTVEHETYCVRFKSYDTVLLTIYTGGEFNTACPASISWHPRARNLSPTTSRHCSRVLAYLRQHMPDYYQTAYVLLPDREKGVYDIQ